MLTVLCVCCCTLPCEQKKKSSAANRVNWGRVVETAIQALTKSIATETFGLWKMNLPEEVMCSSHCHVCVLSMAKNSVLMHHRSCLFTL